MKERFQKQLHPAAVAAVILIVFIVVQYVWWRGLVYRPPAPGAGGGGGGGPAPEEQVILYGRNDVITDTFSGDVAPGKADGPGHAARFDRPTGISIDGQGNVYVADTGNHRIRRIAPDSTTITLTCNEAGYLDGPVDQALFNSPCGVCAAPDGAVYVADTANHCIRRILKGQVTTVVGKPTGDPKNAASGTQKLLLPTAVAYLPGATPALMVTDAGDKTLRKYSMDGALTGEQALPGAPTYVAAAPGIAIAMPQAGILRLGASSIHNMPVEDEYAYANPRGPFLRHPVGLWPFGNGWIATDSGHGAVFFVHNNRATVLAGYASTGLPYRGVRDGEGSHTEFSTISGVTSDGRKHVYVADTYNNCIRRLTIPEYIGR